MAQDDELTALYAEVKRRRLEKKDPELGGLLAEAVKRKMIPDLSSATGEELDSLTGSRPSRALAPLASPAPRTAPRAASGGASYGENVLREIAGQAPNLGGASMRQSTQDHNSIKGRILDTFAQGQQGLADFMDVVYGGKLQTDPTVTAPPVDTRDFLTRTLPLSIAKTGLTYGPLMAAPQLFAGKVIGDVASGSQSAPGAAAGMVPLSRDIAQGILKGREAGLQAGLGAFGGSLKERATTDPASIALDAFFLGHGAQGAAKSGRAIRGRVAETTRRPVVPNEPVNTAPVPGRMIQLKEKVGQVTNFATKDDRTPDSNSARGIGAFPHSSKPGSMVPGVSVAIRERDLGRQLRAAGIKPGDTVDFRLSNGEVHRFRWDDKIPDSGSGGSLDVYNPKGRENSFRLNGARVEGFSRVGRGSTSGRGTLPPPPNWKGPKSGNLDVSGAAPEGQALTPAQREAVMAPGRAEMEAAASAPLPTFDPETLRGPQSAAKARAQELARLADEAAQAADMAQSGPTYTPPSERVAAAPKAAPETLKAELDGIMAKGAERRGKATDTNQGLRPTDMDWLTDAEKQRAEEIRQQLPSSQYSRAEAGERAQIKRTLRSQGIKFNPEDTTDALRAKATPAPVAPKVEKVTEPAPRTSDAIQADFESARSEYKAKFDAPQADLMARRLAAKTPAERKRIQAEEKALDAQAAPYVARMDALREELRNTKPTDPTPSLPPAVQPKVEAAKAEAAPAEYRVEYDNSLLSQSSGRPWRILKNGEPVPVEELSAVGVKGQMPRMIGDRARAEKIVEKLNAKAAPKAERVAPSKNLELVPPRDIPESQRVAAQELADSLSEYDPRVKSKEIPAYTPESARAWAERIVKNEASDEDWYADPYEYSDTGNAERSKILNRVLGSLNVDAMKSRISTRVEVDPKTGERVTYNAKGQELYRDSKGLSAIRQSLTTKRDAAKAKALKIAGEDATRLNASTGLPNPEGIKAAGEWLAYEVAIKGLDFAEAAKGLGTEIGKWAETHRDAIIEAAREFHGRNIKPEIERAERQSAEQYRMDVEEPAPVKKADDRHTEISEGLKNKTLTVYGDGTPANSFFMDEKTGEVMSDVNGRPVSLDSFMATERTRLDKAQSDALQKQMDARISSGKSTPAEVEDLYRQGRISADAYNAFRELYNKSSREYKMPPINDGKTAPAPEPVAPKVEEHHSTAQPRDDAGRFNGPPVAEKVELPAPPAKRARKPVEAAREALGGMRHADQEAIADALGYDLPAKQSVSHAEEVARAFHLAPEIDASLRDWDANEPLPSREHRTRAAMLQSEAMRRFDELVAAKAPQGQIDAALAEAARYGSMLYKSGSEAGRDLALQKILFPDPEDATAILSRAEAMTEGKISPAARRELVRLSNEAKVAKAAAVERLEKKAAAAESAIKNTRRSTKPRTASERKTPEFGTTNTKFTRDRYEAAKKRIAASSARLNASIGVPDPAVFRDMVDIGGYYVEGGIKRFGEWAKAMREDVAPDASDALLGKVWTQVLNKSKNLLTEDEIALARAERNEAVASAAKSEREKAAALAAEEARVAKLEAARLAAEERGKRAAALRGGQEAKAAYQKALKEKRDADRKAAQAQAKAEREANFAQNYRKAAEERLQTLGQRRERTSNPLLDIATAEYAKGVSDLKRWASDVEKRYGSTLSPETRQRLYEEAARRYSEENKTARQVKKQMAELLAKEVDKTRPTWQKTWKAVKHVMGTSMSLVASMDFSGVGNQGGIILMSNPEMLLGRPGKHSGAIKLMFQAAGREEVAQGIMDSLNAQQVSRHNDPDFFAKVGLDLTEMDGASGSAGKEEAFQFTAIEKIPGAGRPYRATERAYSVVTNALRVAMFNKLYDPATMTLEEAKGAAAFANVVGGRGNLKPEKARAMAEFSGVFFSPRFATSRVQYLLGTPLITAGSPRMRRAIAGQYLRYFVAYNLINGAAYALGWKKTSPVSQLNPQNFGDPDNDTIEFPVGDGKTISVPTTPGLLQYVRFASQLATGRKDYGGGISEPQDASRAIERFIRGKLAPVPSVVRDLIPEKDGKRKNYIGKPVTLGGEVRRLTVPMSLGTLWEGAEDSGYQKEDAVPIVGNGIINAFGWNSRFNQTPDMIQASALLRGAGITAKSETASRRPTKNPPRPPSPNRPMRMPNAADRMKGLEKRLETARGAERADIQSQIRSLSAALVKNPALLQRLKQNQAKERQRQERTTGGG